MRCMLGVYYCDVFRCAQQLAGDILDDPVHVHIGGFNLTANEDIHQVSARGLG